MHVYRMKLNTTAYDEQVLDKQFHAIAHIHNVLVKHAIHLIRKIDCNKDYQFLKADYGKLLKKKKLSDGEKEYKKQLSSKMSEIRENIGLTKTGLEKYITVCAKQFKKSLYSQQIQKEADRVWEGVEKVLFCNGKNIHFKKFMNFHTISSKSASDGAKFNKETFEVEWERLGLNMSCKLPKKEKDLAYLSEALNHDVSYCEIERKMFPNGWHYYVIIYLKGDAPKKVKEIGNPYNVTGIDIGTSTIATVSENMVTLEELAPRCKEYNIKIAEIQKHMDNSKRALNPAKYNTDGTINERNHDKWKFSNTYFKNRRKLKSLYRQKAAYIKQSHEEIIVKLIKNSTTFIVENMSFKGLQKRSTKKAERSEKISGIKQKDGTVKQVRKFKKKKRYGKSLNNRAPSRFVLLLTMKAELYGGSVTEVNTKEFRASQYNHVTNEYTKMSINDRDKTIDGNYVQRDLYSAFLLKNSNKRGTKANRKKCEEGFENYLKMQNELIEYMKANKISKKACFGF